MAPQSSESHPFTLPLMRETFRFPKSSSSQPRIFYDVKFYPYHAGALPTPPVFAVVGCRETFICRPAVEKGKTISVLKVFRDNEQAGDQDLPTAVLNSCGWNFVDQSDPLISVAGPSGKIKVLHALTGELYTTLIGHGAEINDLATHPLYPWILASASGDHSIRIWDLRRRMEKGENACLIICGHGHGHKEGVLTAAWHSGGRYLISGGLDHMMCIWTIPELSPSSAIFDPTTNRAGARTSAETTVIHYPHFITSAIHSNFVDCVLFYGDFVLSKCAEEHKIVLWMITGFNSKLPVPGKDQAPKTGEFKDTRNGFMPRISRSIARRNGSNGNSSEEEEEDDLSPPEPYNPPPFHRLLEFSILNSESFYMRFSLLTPSPSHPTLHPVLAHGNTKSRIFFWDLTRLELGHDAGLSTTSTSFLRPEDRSRKRNNNNNNNNNKSNRDPAVGSSSSSIIPARAAASFSSATTTTTQSTNSPAPPSSPSSRRSSSIATGFSSSSILPDGRAGSTAATSFSASGSGSGGGSVAPSSLTATATALAPAPAPHVDRKRYPIHQPFEPLLPHHKGVVPGVYFTARQIGWSACGRWCVVVGEAPFDKNGTSDALGVVFDRWL